MRLNDKAVQIKDEMDGHVLDSCPRFWQVPKPLVIITGQLGCDGLAWEFRTAPGHHALRISGSSADHISG